MTGEFRLSTKAAFMYASYRNPNYQECRSMNDIPPSLSKGSFNCPHCGAHAQQFWYKPCAQFVQNAPLQFSPVEHLLRAAQSMSPGELVDVAIPKLGETLKHSPQGLRETLNIFFSNCYNCKKISLWAADELVYPKNKFAGTVNPDLAPEIKTDVEEAMSIVDLSPRGAAALLRLSLQKICLIATGKDNINDGIAALAKKGLDREIIDAMDILRVIGNHAVHDGKLDIRDNREVALQLFKIVDVLAERLITYPKKVSELHNMLPKKDKEAIAKRDGLAAADKG